MYCKKCEHRVAMSAFSNGSCTICGAPIFCSSTPADTICEECAETLNICQHCGEPLSDNLPKKEIPATPEDARKAGFNECLSLIYRASGMNNKVSNKDPDNREDKKSIIAEASEISRGSFNKGYFAAFDELAEFMNIPDWNSKSAQETVDKRIKERGYAGIEDSIVCDFYDAVNNWATQKDGGLLSMERQNASINTLAEFCKSMSIDFEAIWNDFVQDECVAVIRSEKEPTPEESIERLMKRIALAIGDFIKLIMVQRHLDMKEQETKENIFALIDYDFPGDNKPIFFLKSAMHSKDDLEDVIAGLHYVIKRDCKHPENVHLCGDMVYNFFIDFCGCDKSDPGEWETQILYMSEEEYHRKYVLDITEALDGRSNPMFSKAFGPLVEEYRHTPYMEAIITHFDKHKYNPKKPKSIEKILENYKKKRS